MREWQVGEARRSAAINQPVRMPRHQRRAKARRHHAHPELRHVQGCLSECREVIVAMQRRRRSATTVSPDASSAAMTRACSAAA